MFSLRRHRRLLRTALLVLLALGIVVQPVLGAMSELHEVEHAISAQFDHAHDHGDDHAHDQDVAANHEHGGNGSDPDHATGSHGLLHQVITVSAILPEAMTSVLQQVPSEPRLSESGPFQLPGDTPNLPFRPPIA